MAKKSCTTPLFFSLLSLSIYICICICICMYVCATYSLWLSVCIRNLECCRIVKVFLWGQSWASTNIHGVPGCPEKGFGFQDGSWISVRNSNFSGGLTFQRNLPPFFGCFVMFHQIGVLEIYGFLWSPHLKPGRSPRPARPATLRSRTLMHGRWRAARRQPREPGRVRWIWEIYEETNGFSRGNHGKPVVFQNISDFCPKNPMKSRLV